MRLPARLLATGSALALAVALAPLSAPAAHAAPPASSSAFAPGDKAFVDVAVATMWTEPGLQRAMDAPSLTNPVDLRRWSLNMQHTDDRAWLSNDKLETQAVLGSQVEVTDVEGDWVKVVVYEQPTPRDARGYPGWLPAAQLVKNPGYAAQLTGGPRAVVTDRTTWLTKDAARRNPTTEISVNTELPILDSRPGVVKVALPDGSSRWLDAHAVDVREPGQKPPAPTGQDIIDSGSRFLGLRYLWAGVSGFGFDCSGFTYTVFRAHGIIIPRDAGPQAASGTPVARDRLRPGDLVFFAKPGGVGSVHHVAIYAGDGKILHSPNSSRNVEIVDLARFDVDKEYSGARRYL